MDKLITALKTKHSIKVTKDDFKSFSTLKPHLEVLVTKILMGQLVLSHSVDSPELYSPNNINIQKSTEFYKAFQLDDNGIATLKAVRFFSFIRHLTGTMLGWTEPFCTTDITEAKSSRFITLTWALFHLASFTNIVSSNIATIIAEVISAKENQGKYLESIEERERDLLKDIASYESLMTIKENYLLNRDQCIEINMNLKKSFEEIKCESVLEDNYTMQFKHKKEDLLRQLEKVENETNNLHGLFVDNPETMADELMNIDLRVKEEQLRFIDLSKTCLQLSLEVKQVSFVEVNTELFNNNVDILINSAEKLSEIRHEISSHNFSKRELCILLKEDIRNKNLYINQIKRDKESRSNDIAILEEKIETRRKNADVTRKKIEVTRLKCKMLRNSVVNQIEEEREKKVNIVKEYEEKMKKLERNVSKTMEEILEAYKKL